MEIFKKNHKLLKVLLIVLITLFVSCSFNNDSNNPISITDYSNYTFSDNIGTIYLAISPIDLQYLLTHPKGKGIEYEKECSFLGVFDTDTIILNCGLRIHGGVSREYPKKSFRLYFRENELVSDNIFKLFPVKSYHRNKFPQIVLNASAIDFSNMRNFLGMYITSQLGAFAPRVDFVRVYINETYYGLYQITERINDDMAENITMHNNYDLLKAENHNGNLKTENYYFDGSEDSDSIVSPFEGFELKEGDTISLSNLVYWLESDSATFNELKEITTDRTLYAFFMGCYYTADSDVFSKNYYFLNDKINNTFEFIRWDADAVFGRNWKGKIEDPLLYEKQVEKNGLYNFLKTDSDWKNLLIQKYSESFNNSLNADALISLVDDLEELLETEVLLNNKRWSDILLNYFNNEKGWDYWEDSSSDTLAIWRNDLEIIRNFIRERDETISAELQSN